MVETIQWTGDGVVMIDQTRLPLEEIYVTCRDLPGGRRARFATWSSAARRPLAWRPPWEWRWARFTPSEANFDCQMETVCANARRDPPHRGQPFLGHPPHEAALRLLRGRPLAEIRARWCAKRARSARRTSPSAAPSAATARALVPDGKTVLTHCNAGALATAGYGTALGVIRAAVEAGKHVDVFADETRPFLQGARLTAWELQQDGIPCTLITDNMAGHFLQSGRIGCVVVGADRIARQRRRRQ